MNFNWENYLIIAKELCGKANGETPTKEAKIRCSISRAYYSAFCIARNFLKDSGKVPPKDSTVHQFVKTEFFDSNNKDWKTIGANLDRLRTLRNKADYYNIYHGNQRQLTSILMSESITSLSHSESVIGIINKLSNNENGLDSPTNDK